MTVDELKELVQRDLPTSKETDELYLAYTAYGNLRSGNGK